MLKALKSFKKGAGGGPDGFLPQHLLDMCGDDLGDPATKLLETLVTFMNSIVYPGKVPSTVRDSFYGANLIALKKLTEESDPKQLVLPSDVWQLKPLCLIAAIFVTWKSNQISSV